MRNSLPAADWPIRACVLAVKSGRIQASLPVHVSRVCLSACLSFCLRERHTTVWLHVDCCAALQHQDPPSRQDLPHPRFDWSTRVIVPNNAVMVVFMYVWNMPGAIIRCVVCVCGFCSTWWGSFGCCAELLSSESWAEQTCSQEEEKAEERIDWFQHRGGYQLNDVMVIVIV